VVRFYRDEMPLVRWVPEGQAWADDRVVMRFRKGNESCIVTIGYEGRVGRKVAIEVVIMPAGE
jgi:hypothetical protein